MDSILIRNLAVSAIIGVYPEERLTPQTVIINAELSLDLTRASVSDDFRDALNYAELESGIRQLAGSSGFFLLEKLAGEIAAYCLSFEPVQRVEITVDKPGAPRFAESIAVRIVRSREQGS